MKKLILMLPVIFLWSCTDNQSTTELDFSVKIASETSTKAFKNTVYPILRQNCASCHGDNGSAIRHSVTDYIEAHDVLVDGGKVNFASPASSRIVDKLLSQNHNCWGGDCIASSNEMLAAIKKWIEIRGVTVDTIGNKVTNNLKYADAIKRIPETMNGTIVLQAEDGELVGRMHAKTSSTASSFSYIAGDDPPNHPIELTPRTGAITPNDANSCKIMSEDDKTKMINGRYRISESKRHVDHTGYRAYSQRVSFRIIRPDKRDAYIEKIKAGETSLTDLQGFFLTAGTPVKDNSGAYVIDSDGKPVYDGNVVEAGTGGQLRILPEFLDKATYDGTILNEPTNCDANCKTIRREFFAPRFSGDYFLPTNEEIRNSLPSYVKQEVYNIVKASYKNIYFNGTAPRTPIYFMRFHKEITPLVDKTQNNVKLLLKYFDLTTTTTDENLAISDFTDNDIAPLSKVNDKDGVATSIDKIDTYVHYYVDPADRAFADFSWPDSNDSDSEPDLFDIDRGTEQLNLSELYVNPDDFDIRPIMQQNFADTLHPILLASCARCHGDGANGSSIKHSSTNIVSAYDNIIGYINFNTPSFSRPVSRMDEGHNCGNNCSSLKAEIISAIELWKQKNAIDIEAAGSASSPLEKELSLKDRTVGRARYKFKVTEAGAYSVWTKIQTASATRDSFRLRILDAAGRPLKSCQANSSCAKNESDYTGKTPDQVEGLYCYRWDPGAKNMWEWYTPSLGDIDKRIKWDLEEGEYTLELIEQDIDAKIDMVAISKNPEFNPAENLIDEGVVASAAPRILRYDISPLLGNTSTGFFEIEIVEANGGDSYIFRNPQIVGVSENVKVSDIKLLVNDTYEFANSAFTKINHVVGPTAQVLTTSPLVALSIAGTGSDTFKFAFGDLKNTSSSLTKVEDDVPVAVEGRRCLNLDLFKRTVKPIVSQIRLMKKIEDDDGIGYQTYSSESGEFPGVNRAAKTSPVIYTCTTCHKEDHPYFKMTTFDDDEVLCAQALSRVDFDNYEKSLLLRGINGTFNHPKLHFLESIPVEGSGADLTFKSNANKVNGFDSSWLGLRFAKYSVGTGVGQINLSAYTGSTRVYLEKFIGQYQRIRYQRINDAFSVRNGDVKLPLDIENALPFDPEFPDRWQYATSGQNLTEVINPEDFVNNQEDLNPANPTSGGPIRVLGTEDSDPVNCIDKPFQLVNGVYEDTCHNNVNAFSEFENVKTVYRDTVVNWMNEEAKAAETCKKTPGCSIYAEPDAQ